MSIAQKIASGFNTDGVLVGADGHPDGADDVLVGEDGGLISADGDRVVGFKCAHNLLLKELLFDEWPHSERHSD